jgi:hypothetical protein
LIVVTLLLALAPAPAASAADQAFSGRCQLAGVVEHAPPLTGLPTAAQLQSRLSGPCWGTWTPANGRPRVLDGDVVDYAVQAAGTLSCGGGTATGAGSLDYEGARLDFDFSEVRGPGAAQVSLVGKAGGVAGGPATVSTAEDPLAITLACMGAGLRTVRIDLALTTPGIAG